MQLFGYLAAACIPALLAACGTDEPIGAAPDAATASSGGTGGLPHDGGAGQSPDAAAGGGNAGAGGAAVCSAERADCNGIASDGCETDLLTTSEHCGVCNHHCVLGQCQLGECKPSTISFADGVVEAITVDATHVYWATSSGNIERVPKTGGSAEPLAHMAGVLAIAVDAEYVYLATSAETKRLPLSGGQPTPFASLGGSGGARVFGELLYLAGGGGLGRVPLAGGAPTLLDARPVAAFVVDATHAHYSELGSNTHLWQIALETSLVAPIVELDASGGIVADAAHLYYFGPKLTKLAKAGGAPELVSNSTAESARDWCELVQNEARLFWAAGSDLRSVRKDGSDERVIDSLASTTCIAADESAIYYYSAIKGSVRQLAM